MNSDDDLSWKCSVRVGNKNYLFIFWVFDVLNVHKIPNAQSGNSKSVAFRLADLNYDLEILSIPQGNFPFSGA